MSRITKEIARYVAKELITPKRKELEKVQKSNNEFAYGAFSKKIPKEVMELFEKQKNYFSQKDHFRMIGNGWNYEHLSTGKALPDNGNHVIVDEKTSSQLLKNHNNYKDLEKKYKELFNEVEMALLSLKTFSKVVSEFPEAAKFLPKTVSQSLVVNIDKIREKL